MLSAIKNYLRVDSNEEDLLITGLQLAAENYLANAGCLRDYDNDLYQLAIMLLVGHWHENRQVEDTKTVNKLSFSLDTIIAQLKYCRPEVAP